MATDEFVKGERDSQTCEFRRILRRARVLHGFDKHYEFLENVTINIIISC